MPGNEHCTAVFIRQNGRFERADPPGKINGIIFVQPDQWPEHRKMNHRIGGGDGFHGLAGDLPHAFTGDQALAMPAPG